MPTERRFPVLPTMLTLGNAFCGFAAITYAARVGPDLTQPTDSYLRWSAIYVFLGMLFDAIDGPVARLTGQKSRFGEQLDSMCDVVTFGVAPAFLLRQFSAHSFLHPRVLWGVAALYVVCAILRLARFNTDMRSDEERIWFDGLPTPAAAATIASFPIAMNAVQQWLDPSNARIPEVAREVGGWLNWALVQSLPLVAIALAFLMDSTVRYPHLTRQLLGRRRDRRQIVRIAFGLVTFFVIRELALLLACSIYVLAGPLHYLWTCIWPRSRVEPPPSKV